MCLVWLFPMFFAPLEFPIERDASTTSKYCWSNSFLIKTNNFDRLMLFDVTPLDPKNPFDPFFESWWFDVLFLISDIRMATKRLHSDKRKDDGGPPKDKDKNSSKKQKTEIDAFDYKEFRIAYFHNSQLLFKKSTAIFGSVDWRIIRHKYDGTSLAGWLSGRN